ncbi:DUF4214 domain-containing protein [Massilia sp. YIM B02443]|uniref:DUF4214 domain-containing protein n=1 Tax=Massilia sp. YIM B02443 TaxID=3050127 RepID=UPI0025B668FF|nr:DUF4214 domain-containing protein [Massilia sp. YIM B02443]MDN4036548.1 DUF4214 domain-containing protein [Massilia sp. YIM B02443]
MYTEPDYAPVGIVDDRDTLFSTLQRGDLAATLSPIDTGLATGGRWVIDAESRPGLFTIDYDPAVDTSARLLIADASKLQPGAPVTVTVHYYDHFQLDANGKPLAGRGIAETLVYSVEAGATKALEHFGNEFALGVASQNAAPAMATLADGGFVTVWQASSTDGGQLWAQLRDAGGNARGAAFAVTSAPDAAAEGEPSVAALHDGRFVVAYTVRSGEAAHIAYRIVGPDGSAGAQQFADTGAAADTAMPDVAVLDDGSFALAWRAGGQVQVRQFGLDGAPLGAQQTFGALGSAYDPDIVAHGSGFVVAWGEIGDGNVYAAGPGQAPAIVSGDGYAATLSTAAPLASIAALSDGGYVVAWDSYLNSPYGFAQSDIFFQRYDAAGHAAGSRVQANVDGGAGRFAASVAAQDDGGFVIGWQSQAGDFDGNGIFARRFDASGTALDVREFAVNELRQGDQASPVLSTLAGGGLATAWVDTQADGTLQVEARVLAADAPAAPAAPAQPGTGTLAGGGSLVATQVTGTAARDLFVAGAGSHAIDGGSGIDTVVYRGAQSAFALDPGADGFHVTGHAGGGADTLRNVERLVFDDGNVALDVDGTAGQAYRLYQAAFDRAPDAEGLAFWIGAMDGGIKLQDVARSFLASAEFTGRHGQMSDAGFLEVLYQHVLHRAPDAAGFQFWRDALQVHHVAREAVLAQFSESAENREQVSDAIAHGIAYGGVDGGAAGAGCTIEGGSGLDTVVYCGARDAYALALGQDGFQVNALAGGGADTLHGVERLVFNDGQVALDIDGAAGQAYRLYQAAFDRAPDLEGLGFWIGAMDRGVGLQDVARSFVGSAEFTDRYGPTTDTQFLDLLYQHVQHREPDAAGFQFWSDALQVAHAPREAVLASFSESAENQAQVIGSIQHGIDFIGWAAT